MTLTYYLFPKEREEKYIAHKEEELKRRQAARDLWIEWTKMEEPTHLIQGKLEYCFDQVIKLPPFLKGKWTGRGKNRYFGVSPKLNIKKGKDMAKAWEQLYPEPFDRWEVYRILFDEPMLIGSCRVTEREEDKRPILVDVENFDPTVYGFTKVVV